MMGGIMRDQRCGGAELRRGRIAGRHDSTSGPQSSNDPIIISMIPIRSEIEQNFVSSKGICKEIMSDASKVTEVRTITQILIPSRSEDIHFQCTDRSHRHNPPSALFC